MQGEVWRVDERVKEWGQLKPSCHILPLALIFVALPCSLLEIYSQRGTEECEDVSIWGWRVPVFMCFKFTFSALSLSSLSWEFEHGESSSTYFPLALGHRYSSSSSRFTQNLVSPPSSQVYHFCNWHDYKIKFPAVEVKRSTAQLPLSKGSILAFW